MLVQRENISEQAEKRFRRMFVIMKLIRRLKNRIVGGLRQASPLGCVTKKDVTEQTPRLTPSWVCIILKGQNQVREEIKRKAHRLE